MILLKKAYQRLPESELDIMLALWNGTPPMTRAEIEKLVNVKKQLAPTFCGEAGKDESVYASGIPGRLSGK